MQSTTSTPAQRAAQLPATQFALGWWRRWWRKQTPSRQDRFVTLGPLFAVFLFLAAVVAAFGYLRIEEMDREQEAVRRDVEYAQQRLRLRLIERQEQLMRLGRDVSNKEIEAEEFVSQAEALVNQYPELRAVSWVDARRRVRLSYASPSAGQSTVRGTGDQIKSGETEASYALARDIKQPVYSRPIISENDTRYKTGTLQLHVPMNEQGRVVGVIFG